MVIRLNRPRPGLGICAFLCTISGKMHSAQSRGVRDPDKRSHDGLAGFGSFGSFGLDGDCAASGEGVGTRKLAGKRYSSGFVKGRVRARPSDGHTLPYLPSGSHARAAILAGSAPMCMR